MKKILIICDGNTCRSSKAKAVLEQILASGGMWDGMFVDSAAGGKNHHPDRRRECKTGGKRTLTKICQQNTTPQVSEKGILDRLRFDPENAGEAENWGCQETKLINWKNMLEWKGRYYWSVGLWSQSVQKMQGRNKMSWDWTWKNETIITSPPKTGFANAQGTNAYALHSSCKCCSKYRFYILGHLGCRLWTHGLWWPSWTACNCFWAKIPELTFCKLDLYAPLFSSPIQIHGPKLCIRLNQLWRRLDHRQNKAQRQQYNRLRPVTEWASPFLSESSLWNL